MGECGVCGVWDGVGAVAEGNVFAERYFGGEARDVLFVELVADELGCAGACADRGEEHAPGGAVEGRAYVPNACEVGRCGAAWQDNQVGEVAGCVEGFRVAWWPVDDGDGGVGGVKSAGVGACDGEGERVAVEFGAFCPVECSALWVEVEDVDGLALVVEGCGEVHSRGGFSDAAFRGDNGNDHVYRLP